MQFDGMKRLTVALELLGWVSVVLGVVVAGLYFGTRDALAGYAAAGAMIGTGLVVALLSHVARAVAFIAETLDEERNALPGEGGVRAPGRLVDVRYGHEVRALSRRRFWALGRVFDSQQQAVQAINSKGGSSDGTLQQPRP
mgnify:CR=1 FL=1